MTPQEIAHRFDRCLSLAAEWPWRHPEASAFADWLAGFWETDCPLAIAGPPDATSAVGGSADGIRWFAAGGGVLGYAAGHGRGCYRIPQGAEPPESGEPSP